MSLDRSLITETPARTCSGIKADEPVVRFGLSTNIQIMIINKAQFFSISFH